MTEPPAPAPGPLGAVLLTAFAWSVLVLATSLATPATGGTLGLALGLLLGFGGAGTLAARTLPPPADRRIGLVGFAPRALGPLLLLLPVVLLLSELDNVVAAAWFPDAEAPEPTRELGALDHLEWVLFGVLLRPVLEEFFFRGVLQQGLVAALGAARGVLLVAVLFALVRTSLFAQGAYHAASFGLQWLALGALLGFVRLRTGSILASALLLSACEAAGIAAWAFRESFPVPGFNTGEGHTPVSLLLPAAVSVALGLALLARPPRT